MYTIKLIFEDSQGGAPGFQGGQKPPCSPPKCNPGMLSGVADGKTKLVVKPVCGCGCGWVWVCVRVRACACACPVSHVCVHACVCVCGCERACLSSLFSLKIDRMALRFVALLCL